VALLARERPDLRVVLAGRGRDVGRLSGMAQERGIAANVEVVVDPPPERVSELLSGALALAMPSRFEGFGMVAAEAMAAGVPVVAADVDSVPDVVGSDGAVLVPREDPAALAAALGALLDDPARRAELSRAGRARAQRYSWNDVARDHLHFLQRIAAGSTSIPS
jgi:glycosyltransferase involved in cell wall biosynthesis